MNRILLLTGVLLFILGAALIPASYFILNKYSLSGSQDFAATYQGSWTFPTTPLELSEGDIVIVQILINIDRNVQLRIMNTGGTVVFTNTGQNFTSYYYVQTHDLYFMSTQLRSGTVAPCHISYFLEVTEKGPNQLFLLIGIVALLAGTVTIPVAVFYKRKIS